MEIELYKKPKNVTLIEGFPGFGLVSTIATEYLIEHTGAVQIGRIKIPEVPPLVAVHKGTIIEPLGIFYSKKYNLVILYALIPVNGFEWKIADAIHDLAKQLNAKEVIGLEGVNGQSGKPNAFYLTSGGKSCCAKMDCLKKISINKLDEGVVMGVTGALLLKKNLPVSCILAETSTGFPDSRAAAKVIEVLDTYLKLNVDYKPLIKKAEQFEAKIKGLVSKGKDAMEQKQEKELSYFG